MKVGCVGISIFKPFDPSLKLAKSSEFCPEPREISFVISGVVGHTVVFKRSNLAYKSLRFFVEVPKSYLDQELIALQVFLILW